MPDAVCTSCLPVDAVIPFKSVTETRDCTLCGRHREAVPLTELTTALDLLLQQYFEHGPNHEVVGSLGASLDDVLRVLIPSDTPDLHDTLAEALIRTGDPFFARGQGYRQRRGAVDDTGPMAIWRKYEDTVRHRKRFFSTEAEAVLDHLIKRMDAVAGPLHPHRRTLPVGEVIFRGRTANRSGEALKILSDPAGELSPPPPGRRRAGRLNAPGIPVFYGARSIQTLQSELRPAVGSYIAYGEFEVIRPLKLLDLSAFAAEPFSASILAGRYHELLEWRLFFQRLQHIVSRPVLPGEEEAEYLPTQVFAEFLAKNGFDGIVYRSAQRFRSTGSSSSEQNVALFSGQEIVEVAAGSDGGEPAGVVLPGVRFREGSERLEFVRATDVQTSQVHLIGGDIIHPWDILE